MFPHFLLSHSPHGGLVVPPLVMAAGPNSGTRPLAPSLARDRNFSYARTRESGRFIVQSITTTEMFDNNREH